LKTIELKINENFEGMHARPASHFVKLASQFKSEIRVSKNEVLVNGKSILGLLMLALGPGNTFTLEIEGEDEEKAIEELSKLVNNNFILI
jgi:phosphocarrier protein HPr